MRDDAPLLTPVAPRAGASSVKPRMSWPAMVGFASFWAAFFFTAGLVLPILLPKKIASFTSQASKGTALGIVTALGNVVMVGTLPFAGRWSDTTGRRKPFLVAGALALAAGLLLMMIANTLALFAAAFCVACLALAFVIPAYNAAVPEVAPPEQAGQLGAWMSAASTLGGLAAALALLLASARYSVDLMCISSAGLLILCVAASALSFSEQAKPGLPLSVQDPKPSDGPDDEPATELAVVTTAGCIARLFPSLCFRPYQWFLLATFAQNAAQTIVTLYAFYFLSDVMQAPYRVVPSGPYIHTPESAVGAFQVATQASGVAAAAVSSQWSRSSSHRLQAFVWLTLTIAGPLSFVFASQFWVIQAAALSYGAGIGGFMALSYPLLSDILKDAESTRPTGSARSADVGGTEWSLWIIAVLSPKALLPAAVGAMLDTLQLRGHNLGYFVLFAIAAVFVVFGALASLGITHRTHAHHP